MAAPLASGIRMVGGLVSNGGNERRGSREDVDQRSIAPEKYLNVLAAVDYEDGR